MFEDCETVIGSPGCTDRRLNVIQLMCLSFMIGLGAGIVALLAGFGWITALLTLWGGWFCGAFGVTALLMLADSLFDDPTPNHSELPRSDAIDATIAAWDRDLASDRQATRDTEGDIRAMTAIEGGARSAARRKG